MTGKRPWVVLPDLLSVRVFVDTGILRGLHERLDGRLAAVFLVPQDAAAEWEGRLGDIPVLRGDELVAPDGLLDRAFARADAWLDRRIGYHPLAIRLNYRHGFHEGVEFAVAIGDVGQALKVENLARDEATGGDDDLAGEADAAF